MNKYGLYASTVVRQLAEIVKQLDLVQYEETEHFGVPCLRYKTDEDAAKAEVLQAKYRTVEGQLRLHINKLIKDEAKLLAKRYRAARRAAKAKKKYEG